MRQTTFKISFDGIDVTDDVAEHFKSLTYTDNEGGETDDLQISIFDEDNIWLTKWLNNAKIAEYLGSKEKETDDASKGISLAASIYSTDEDGTHTLDCGEFALDSISISGPPSEVTIKASSLPFGSGARQNDKSRSWESYSLKGIAAEIALNGGLSLMFLTDINPMYSRLEQYKISDVAFLQNLCVRAGLSLKITGGNIVIYEKSEYEAKGTIGKISYGDGTYTNYKLSTNSVGTGYTSCHVSYTTADGNTISGWAYSEKNTEKKQDNCYEMTANVSSVAEAENLAANMLAENTALEYVASFTMPGNPHLLAGCTMEIDGFGAWNGIYMIKTAKHAVSRSGGYVSTITLRRTAV